MTSENPQPGDTSVDSPLAALVPDPPQWLRSPQVCDQTGASYRQLDFWQRRGFIGSRNDGQGSGSQRKWSPDEVAVVSRLVALVKAGIEPSVAAGVARDGRRVVPLSDRVSVQIDQAGGQP
jgi:MerR HTH family regulatory protein